MDGIDRVVRGRYLVCKGISGPLHGSVDMSSISEPVLNMNGGYIDIIGYIDTEGQCLAGDDRTRSDIGSEYRSVIVYHHDLFLYGMIPVSVIIHGMENIMDGRRKVIVK